jgi:hypothetical protein
MSVPEPMLERSVPTSPGIIDASTVELPKHRSTITRRAHTTTN